jgi:hypothetical protein
MQSSPGIATKGSVQHCLDSWHCMLNEGLVVSGCLYCPFVHILMFQTTLFEVCFLDACAHAANMYDADGASLLLDPIRMAYWVQRCKKVLTDTHYRGTFSIMLADEKIAFEITAKLSDKPGFEVLP